MYLVPSSNLSIKLIRDFCFYNNFLNIILRIFLIIFLSIHISNFNLNCDIIFYPLFYFNFNT